MSLIEFILLLIIAAVVGAIGSRIGGSWRGGFFLLVIIGLIGALIGRWLAAQLGLPEFFAVTLGGFSIPILWAIIGAALLVLLLRLIAR